MTTRSATSFRALGIAGALTFATAALGGAAAPLDDEAPDLNKAAKVVVIPLVGQMGTDIEEETILELVREAKSRNPDVVVFKINSADVGTNYHLQQIDRSEFGMPLVTEYRDFADDLHNELAGIRQVAYLEDSVGWASLLALSWDELYMKPEARLWGLNQVYAMAAGWQDPDVRGKMIAAWIGIAQGFLELGDRPKTLGRALMEPNQMLSCSFKGREVEWLSDTSGTWIIDQSDESVANFTATLAEDVMLCDGLAENIDDLVFLLGYREYEIDDFAAEELEKYRTSWRKAFERTTDALRASQQPRGDTPMRQLLDRKRNLETVLRSMRQYTAIERRVQREFGLDMNRLELMIEQINDQIRQVRDAERNRGRGGGRSGGGGGRGLGG